LKASKYDLIIDDGRARVEIMRMAVKHVKVYGLLLLDNAQRPELHNATFMVPSFWLKADFQNSVTRTILYMRCAGPKDAICQRARREMSREV